MTTVPKDQASIPTSPRPSLLLRSGIRLLIGASTGLIMLGVGKGFDMLEGALPAIQAEYANKAIFRDWPGWTETYFRIHPFWFGFVFAFGFMLISRGRSFAGWGKTAGIGALYGSLVFLVGSLPILALLYASFRVSVGLVLVSWAARNLAQYIVAGVFLALLTRVWLPKNH